LFPEFDVASTLSVAVPPAVVSIANYASSNGNTIATSVATPVTSSTNQSTLSAGEFFFNAAHKPIFNEVRGSFGILIDELVPLIAQSIPSAEKMKSFLQRSFPELSVELSTADDIDSIMSIIVKKCRVNDISIIKTIVKRFKIAEANPLISEYEDEVKAVCGSLKDFLSQNQPEHFNDFETIQFTLGWEPDEHSLDDIRNLLEEAFKELNKRIIVRSIHRGNSIIIICYAPHHLLAALLLEAQDNLTVLMKEFSLIRLTIGHYTVYDKRIRYKVMNNECLAEEIKVADGEEQELRTLLDYKKYIERTLQTPEPKLKAELLTREKFINEIFKSKKSEAQFLRTSLLMKAGREEALVEYIMQESILNTQLLLAQKAKIQMKDQCTQSLVVGSPTAESVYIARYDYHALGSGDFSFSEGEHLEIHRRADEFSWKGKSLVSGDNGKIPSSHIYSFLESIIFFDFIMAEQEISLPILHKIRNDSSSNDEKASLFLETINDDPIMISALRQDKRQHEEGVTGGVYWDNEWITLSSPSPIQ
uniref:SH3 domain-containing protein n=1 Tax=Amphimedon queenslandica TaxID=400682 RepID=A0A1X7SUM0_AMPQE